MKLEPVKFGLATGLGRCNPRPYRLVYPGVRVRVVVGRVVQQAAGIVSLASANLRSPTGADPESGGCRMITLSYL